MNTDSLISFFLNWKSLFVSWPNFPYKTASTMFSRSVDIPVFFLIMGKHLSLLSILALGTFVDGSSQTEDFISYPYFVVCFVFSLKMLGFVKYFFCICHFAITFPCFMSLCSSVLLSDPPFCILLC